MTGTRERRKEKTRERILEAAQAMILEKGFEKLSLRAIAREVEYSPAGLYEYFANKEELIAAVSARVSHRLFVYLKAAISSSEETPLLALGLAYIGFAREHSEEFLLMFSRLISSRQHHQDEMRETSPYTLLYKQIEAQRTSGELTLPSTADTNDIAYGIWALCHGAAMLQNSHLATYQADFAHADRMALEALLNGYQR